MTNLTEYRFDKGTCSIADKMPFKKEIGAVVIFSECLNIPLSKIRSLYCKYGVEFIHHFDEDYCFFLFDITQNILIAVRDKIGKNRIYYAQLRNSILLSSNLGDIAPLLKHQTINAHALAEGIRYNFPITPKQTWIEQINRLEPGEYLVVDKDGFYVSEYWKRNYQVLFTGTREEALKKSLEILRSSIKRSICESEGPVAIPLSGGIDSSSLAIISQEFQKEVHVISAGYKGNYSCDERATARRLSTDFGFIYHEIELDSSDFKSIFDIVAPMIDEPCFDIACMSQYAVYNKASELGCKTVLSGIGGDELFYSYNGYNKLAEALVLRNEFNDLTPVKKNPSQYLRFLAKNWRYVLFPNYPTKIDITQPVPWTYRDYTSFAEVGKLSTNSQHINFKDIDVQYLFSEKTDIVKMYDMVFNSFMIKLCLYLSDKMSKANNISVACPYLNSELISFIDNLPVEMKYSKGLPKQFQKDMLKGVVPNYILQAPKKGFEPPFDFIKKITSSYNYKNICSDFVFFNSMAADIMISNCYKNEPCSNNSLQL